MTDDQLATLGGEAINAFQKIADAEDVTTLEKLDELNSVLAVLEETLSDLRRQADSE